MRNLLVLLFLLLIYNYADANKIVEECKPVKENYYSDKYRGWYFKEQCEKKIIKQPEEKTKKEISHDEEIVIDWKKIRDTKYLDTLNAKTFNKLFTAVKEEVIYNPNHEKLLAYLELQDYMKNKSLTFAYVWRDVLLENPRLDHTIKMPGTNYGSDVRYKVVKRHQKQVIDEIREKAGIFYFSSIGCQFCEHQTPIINMLIRDYNVEVKTITQDECSEAMPNCIVDNTGALFQNFGVQQVPAIVMVIRGEDDKPIFQPIGYGIQTMDEIVNKLVFYYKYRKTGKYPEDF